MEKAKKIFRYFTDSDYRFIIDANRGKYNDMPDEAYLKKKFKIMLGYELNLDNPRTFNEKLQWLKLYDRNPLYSKLVDKYEVKEYVSSIIGDEYIIPTIGVWDSFDEIDFNSLPDQFVLKCTHDSGGLLICKDKNKLDINTAREIINKSLSREYFYLGREWPYKDIKPRIIAEPYLEDDSTHELRDYKFFTFCGIPKAMFIASERGSNNETKFDFFDMDFNHLQFTNGHPNADEIPSKPLNFEKMKLLASKLSQNIPHLRVDFYEANGRLYFGELTFFHWSGMTPFDPPQWDIVFGEWITLPEKSNS